MLVLDASVGSGKLAVEAARQRAYAPWRSDARGRTRTCAGRGGERALAQGARRRDHPRQKPRRRQRDIAWLFTRLVPLRALQDQALDLALRSGHPVYDCFYVALAMREAVPLLTADRRLAQRFGGDVEVLLPTA